MTPFLWALLLFRHRPLLPFRHRPLPPISSPFLSTTPWYLLSSSTPPAPRHRPLRLPVPPFRLAPFGQIGPNGGPLFGPVWLNGRPSFGHVWPNGGPWLNKGYLFGHIWPNGGPLFGQTGPIWLNEGPPFGQTGPNRIPPFSPVWPNDAGREGGCWEPKRAGAEKPRRGVGREQVPGSGERVLGKG